LGPKLREFVSTMVYVLRACPVLHGGSNPYHDKSDDDDREDGNGDEDGDIVENGLCNSPRAARKPG
jgi:hypothetical protein